MVQAHRALTSFPLDKRNPPPSLSLSVLRSLAADADADSVSKCKCLHWTSWGFLLRTDSLGGLNCFWLHVFYTVACCCVCNVLDLFYTSTSLPPSGQKAFILLQTPLTVELLIQSWLAFNWIWWKYIFHMTFSEKSDVCCHLSSYFIPEFK